MSGVGGTFLGDCSAYAESSGTLNDEADAAICRLLAIASREPLRGSLN